MKKLYLAVVFSFLFGICDAKADLHADFIRVECNKDLGLLSIGDYNIWGHDIGLYFEKKQPFYKYSIDTNGEDKSHAEIILINNFTWEDDKTFKYNCNFAESMSYDVEISWQKDVDCVDFQDANYIINVIENKKSKDGLNSKKIIDKVSLGCKGIKKIYITYDSSNNNTNLTFENNIPKAYFLSDEYEQPITNERIKQKNNDMTVDDKNMGSQNLPLFAVATDENLEKLNINKSVYDKIINEYYKDEMSLIGNEFSQKLLIAQNLNNIYVFILNSSVNCGSVGCHSKLFSIDTQNNYHFIGTGDVYDCDYLKDDIYRCFLL